MLCGSHSRWRNFYVPHGLHSHSDLVLFFICAEQPHLGRVNRCKYHYTNRGEGNIIFFLASFNFFLVHGFTLYIFFTVETRSRFIFQTIATTIMGPKCEKSNNNSFAAHYTVETKYLSVLWERSIAQPKWLPCFSCTPSLHFSIVMNLYLYFSI
jgi:hypothetical protein